MVLLVRTLPRAEFVSLIFYFCHKTLYVVLKIGTYLGRMSITVLM